MQAIGKLSGLVGVLLCLLGVLGRFVDSASVQNFQAINVFIVGVGLMVFACLVKLDFLDKK